MCNNRIYDSPSNPLHNLSPGYRINKINLYATARLLSCFCLFICPLIFMRHPHNNNLPHPHKDSNRIINYPPATYHYV